MFKWNFKKHVYEPYSVPEEWNTPLHTNDLNQIVNCAQCGKEIKFGDTYTSRQIHNAAGFGYPVCGECYEKERNEE